MEKIISQIEKIREINSQHKLVIFVGAGVSKNSGVCSWWELVRDIAKRIGYDDICEKCATKYEHHSECGDGYEFCSSNSDCCWKYNFSADDFLKIPQYFFDTKGETEYYDFLEKTFCKSYTPNDIDKLIIELNPEQIITTNYDHLLEDVKNPNVGSYAIIKCDRDLLEQNGRRYIIKMHGDIDDIRKIVLKEDDYLKYSQNHIIIETYIKSLLIDKTFLFVGYSLNDNNLSLIMSYIDYFVKDKAAKKRSLHYLVVDSVSKPEREKIYWKNRGVELVDLSELSADMKSNTKKDVLKSEQGQSLYTFLRYLKDDKLPYFNNKRDSLIKSLLNSIKQFEAFNFVSYTDLLKVCCFTHPVRVISSYLDFTNKSEYELFKSIIQVETDESTIIKNTFLKAGLSGIQFSIREYDSYSIINDDYNKEDALFEMSLKYQYKEILHSIEKDDNKTEKAYYYSLILRKSNKISKLMDEIEAEIKDYDYLNLSIKQKVIMATHQFNSITLRLLNFCDDIKEQRNELTVFLDNASQQSTAFDTLKRMIGNNGDVLSDLNTCLCNHEEYYMKKSTTVKWSGTIYGDLFDLQCIVYDYYYFYKKNYLMLDWFNNVEKICEPYIKAILCTYYPDEYQFSKNSFGRNQVEPYPINLIDIDMIVKHTKLSNFNNWLSHYKVFGIKIDDTVDIVEIFENFCISMRCFWNRSMEEHLKVFSKLISLVELTQEQKHQILMALIALVTPDEEIGIKILLNSINAIWIYVQKHYDENDELYKTLLTMLLNKMLLTHPESKSYAAKLIEKLSAHADINIYRICNNMIINCNDNREKCDFTFVFRSILLKFDNGFWIEYIKNNIENNSNQEIYTYLVSKVIDFNDEVKNCYKSRLNRYSMNRVPSCYSYPDHIKDTIEILLILLLIGCIPSIEDIDFLRQYTNDSDYLGFLFYPDSFDYSKVKTADYMWCNFINNDKFRETILNHKSEFWSKNDEKRIELGFGSGFENKVAYKYLYD
ncbi:MAG: SIR2 family protein [Ruminiclostridium sp.]